MSSAMTEAEEDEEYLKEEEEALGDGDGGAHTRLQAQPSCTWASGHRGL